MKPVFRPNSEKPGRWLRFTLAAALAIGETDNDRAREVLQWLVRLVFLALPENGRLRAGFGEFARNVRADAGG